MRVFNPSATLPALLSASGFLLRGRLAHHVSTRPDFHCCWWKRHGPDQRTLFSKNFYQLHYTTSSWTKLSITPQQHFDFARFSNIYNRQGGTRRGKVVL